jgi:hypothetical protein
VSGALILHVAARQAAKLFVHEREQLVEGGLVAAPPRLEQLGGLGRWELNSTILRQPSRFPGCF